MIFRSYRPGGLPGVFTAILLAMAADALGQQQAVPGRQFPVGAQRRVEDLPVGRLRTQLERLPVQARERALAWMGSFHFTDLDLSSLHADPEGGIFYADDFDPAPVTADSGSEPPIAEAAVPVSPFPAGLKFHSRPGAPNVLFLNFSGENVSNTSWNTSLGRTLIPAVAFSTDSDFSMFSDAEQAAIKRIWQRVAEDYAPFNIDVTTDRPASFGTRTAHALITRNTDSNGDANPSSTAGGVAYVNVFGNANYATYRPAWIYFNNVANSESYIAEATSHELGHNLGLSHDGTDSASYYGGHGSGDTSWGPIMGTGYNRNVSQWSKGEYYQANNTQDDLATIAGKTAYRVDDHGNTAASATALMVTNGTNVVATTPENDPTNANPANKGVLERNTDVDVFSFVTGNGPISLTVNPWIMPSGTRGGNLDALVELYDSAGTLLLTNNSSSQTFARIQTTLTDGNYYLHVRSVGTGNPTNSTPTGYTSYASVGQYFISGYVVPSGFVIPPAAELQVTDVTLPGAGPKQFTVTYSDNVAINVSTIDGQDLRITGPRGYNRAARFVSIDAPSDGTPRVATYAADPATGGVWTGSDDGTYTIWMQTNQVSDTEGEWVVAQQLGQFNVSVPTVIYSANMDANPGWTLEPLWQYGQPAYSGAGPSAGFTGTNIIAYNLSGNYQNGLSAKYATTPPINCAGVSSVTLRFWRWLRLRNGDNALIQVSTNGTAWTDLWSTTQAVSDDSWQAVQYLLPGWAAGSPSVQLRWGISSGPSQNDIGWNMDDVELVGGGVLDFAPPIASLSASGITSGGSSGHSFTVTFTDASAVRVASLGASDLIVTGPNGYSNVVSFMGVDIASDGTPRMATYAAPVPGTAWDAADNGYYFIKLRDGEITDTLNNAVAETDLGGFAVNIPVTQDAVLTVTVNDPAWGTVNPAGGTFAAGSSVVVTAMPSTFFRFVQWTGDYSAADNPATIVLTTNKAIHAVFGEIVATNHATPYWWLASHGYTNDFENAVFVIGANGVPLWQSYVAGLDPNDPNSQFRLTLNRGAGGTSCVLNWNSATGRVYTLWSSTNLAQAFAPLTGAIDLPWTIQSFTNVVGAGSPRVFYRMEVKKP
jgi:List-Bact-rpt repeat protein/metallopeptidase family M12-like protein